MDRGAWQATFHKVEKSQTGLKNLGTTMQETKEMWFDPWVRKIPWRRKQQPTRVFLLGNPMDRCAWWVPVHGLAKSQT